MASSDVDASPTNAALDPDLERSLEVLKEEVKALADLVIILWRTKGPSSNFRFYFQKERFEDKADLEAYIRKRIPDANVIAAIEEGRLCGYGFFTCGNPLDALKLGRVEWSRSGQHDVIMPERT